MPAALDVNWAEVQMNALTYGVREAARMMGISEEAVLQRSSREGWIRERKACIPLPPTMKQPVIGVIDGPTAQAQAMKNDAHGGRAAGLRLTRRALEALDRDKSDAELQTQEVANVIHTHIKSASVVGGYAASDTLVKVNLGVTSRPQTIDAEFTEVPDNQELP